jgi:hypothetical protein
MRVIKEHFENDTVQISSDNDDLSKESMRLDPLCDISENEKRFQLYRTRNQLNYERMRFSITVAKEPASVGKHNGPSSAFSRNMRTLSAPYEQTQMGTSLKMDQTVRHRADNMQISLEREKYLRDRAPTGTLRNSRVDRLGFEGPTIIRAIQLSIVTP